MGLYDYINSLPEFLGKEEQKKLLNLFYATRDPKIRDILITHNLRLVAKCVLNYKNYDVDLEDLMTIGTLELINVLDKKFDISKGYEFSTLAYIDVDYKLKSYISKPLRSRDAIYQPRLNMNTLDKSEEELDIFDVLASYEDIEEDVAFKDKIERFLKTLSDYERFLIEHKFELNNKNSMTQFQMAKTWGVTETKIQRDLDVLIVKLKTYLLDKKQPVEQEESEKILKFVEVSNNPSHQFVIEHFYGLNGKEKMTKEQISKELGISKKYVGQIISRIRKREEKQANEKIGQIDINDILNYIKVCNNLVHIKLLELFYGLNGNRKHSRAEIAEMMGIKYNNATRRIERIVECIYKNKLMDNNNYGIMAKVKYLDEFYDTLDNDVHKFVFASFYGIKGHEKISRKEMAKILGISISSISRSIIRTEENLQKFIDTKITASEPV